MHWDFNVILGKRKTPGAIHGLNQSKLWIAPGVFYFPRIIKTPNNKILISLLAINENTEKENFPRVVWEKLGTLEKGFFPQNDKKCLGICN